MLSLVCRDPVLFPGAPLTIVGSSPLHDLIVQFGESMRNRDRTEPQGSVRYGAEARVCCWLLFSFRGGTTEARFLEPDFGRPLSGRLRNLIFSRIGAAR